MLNHIVLMGRLTRDPELRRTGTGKPVTSFTLACNRDFKNPQTGESEADFIDCVAWNGTAELVSKYFAKGRMAVVSGRLQIRHWTDSDGAKRRNAEVIVDAAYFGDSKPSSGAGQAPQTYQPERRPAYGAGFPEVPPDMPLYAPGFPEYPPLDDDNGDYPF